jgi:hypothetical protein
MLARQATLPRSSPTGLSPFLRYCCELFVARAKVNSFAIKQIRTLCAKCLGWGVPLCIGFAQVTSHGSTSQVFVPPFFSYSYELPAGPLAGNSCVFTTIRIGPGVWGPAESERQKQNAPECDSGASRQNVGGCDPVSLAAVSPARGAVAHRCGGFAAGGWATGLCVAGFAGVEVAAGELLTGYA